MDACFRHPGNHGRPRRVRAFRLRAPPHDSAHRRGLRVFPHRSHHPRHHPAMKLRPGFTLVELLVAIAVIAVLATITFLLGSRMIERANHVVDIGKMRNINSGILARACENNGIAYSRKEVGNSSYRAWDDSLSLCKVLEEYLPGEDAWLSPVSTGFQERNKNSYAWSRAA
ncbi:MAG: type II secretion system protein, partial [Verrucomicrobiae bacterium]|nr:type II secretion system protein [Verrucomicrobiae bacterium]